MNSNDEILEVRKVNALQAYKDADDGGKRLIAGLLGRKHFVTDRRELITSFEAACEFNNTNPISRRFTEGTESGIAMEMIAEIAKALNGGKVMQGGEKRFYPWFEYTQAGFRFDVAGCDFADAGTASGPRLCTENRDHAIFMGNHFLSLYNKFLNSAS